MRYADMYSLKKKNAVSDIFEIMLSHCIIFLLPHLEPSILLFL